MVEALQDRFVTSYGKEKEKDFVAPGAKDYINTFQKRIAVMEQQCIKESSIFCRPCAWNEFHDNIDILKNKILRERGSVRLVEPEFIKLAESMDLDQFKGLGKFELIDESPANAFVKIDGTKVLRPIGYHLNYQCKRMKAHKQTLFVSQDQYEEWKLKREGKGSKAN